MTKKRLKKKIPKKIQINSNFESPKLALYVFQAKKNKIDNELS